MIGDATGPPRRSGVKCHSLVAHLIVPLLLYARSYPSALDTTTSGTPSPVRSPSAGDGIVEPLVATGQPGSDEPSSSVPREHLAPVGSVVIVAAADDDLGSPVAVDVAERRARPHGVVELVLPDLTAVRARPGAARGVLDGPELAARPIDEATGRLVATDEDLEPPVTVDVVQARVTTRRSPPCCRS